eukprot:CAMPEP_0206455610 /NCGR_PEP_ID=MMETSP0324_2-20121206/21861_1 /ASSEMBLY_ACC=CAM_ASM_000836 /TAXON_ID=2866 /ORGANISM="Crypthecodinium cohnii, Strain Seligo" /LENGTH=154 /DNA_ID=CAMNT_0053926359 /DNA_START=451 /DNA_END=913 /DNA_ORIENTATION=+
MREPSRGQLAIASWNRRRTTKNTKETNEETSKDTKNIEEAEVVGARRSGRVGGSPATGSARFPDRLPHTYQEACATTLGKRVMMRKMASSRDPCSPHLGAYGGTSAAGKERGERIDEEGFSGVEGSWQEQAESGSAASCCGIDMRLPPELRVLH